MYSPNFKIQFIDDTIFLGRSFNNDWNLFTLKPIKRLTFSFDGVTIYLEGYEEYNHLIEHLDGVRKESKIGRSFQLVKCESFTNCFRISLLYTRSWMLNIGDRILSTHYVHLSTFLKDNYKIVRNNMLYLCHIISA